MGVRQGHWKGDNQGKAKGAQLVGEAASRCLKMEVSSLPRGRAPGCPARELGGLHNAPEVTQVVMVVVGGEEAEEA